MNIVQTGYRGLYWLKQWGHALKHIIPESKLLKDETANRKMKLKDQDIIILLLNSLNNIT